MIRIALLMTILGVISAAKSHEEKTVEAAQRSRFLWL
jgi:hypothetical protein